MKPAPPHLPTEQAIATWPDFTPAKPLRILVSGCLAGRPCGVDRSGYGEHPTAAALLALRNVRAVDFCPEDLHSELPARRRTSTGVMATT